MRQYPGSVGESESVTVKGGPNESGENHSGVVQTADPGYKVEKEAGI